MLFKLRGTSQRFKYSFRSKCVMERVDSFIHIFVLLRFRQWSCGKDSFVHLTHLLPVSLSSSPSCLVCLLWFLCFFSFSPSYAMPFSIITFRYLDREKFQLYFSLCKVLKPFLLHVHHDNSDIFLHEILASQTSLIANMNLLEHKKTTMNCEISRN